MTIINTEHAPGAIGPYSQAYETNGLVITSGQLPVNPADGAMPEGIAAQAVRQVLHLHARPLLRGGEGSAQGRPVRD